MDALFWAKIFGINFGLGVVSGIPLEFQFGTNWARFSQYAGGVIGLTLAAEGMFAFFAESAFLGLFLFGAKKLGPKGHFATAVMMFVASWLSGYFIVTTNAFMQYPLGYAGVDRLSLVSAHRYLLNPWAIWEYAHTMTAAVVTGAFVFAALAVLSVGALLVLIRRGRDLSAFLASCAFFVWALLATASTLHPTLLASTSGAELDVTAQNAAASPRALALGLAWWIPALVLAAGYFVYLFWSFRGKTLVHGTEDETYA